MAIRGFFMFDFSFFLNSILLGFALAMDAFSVSLANSMGETDMSAGKGLIISGTFAFFQFLMPLIGYAIVSTLISAFKVIDKAVPFVALGVLCFLGIKMIAGGVGKNEERVSLGKTALLVQGVATSLDALSVGLTIADYKPFAALIAALIIAAVTFGLCVLAIHLGKKLQEKFSHRATIVGGAVLILVGIEIFIKGII